uniref:Uncharacterized protein n=1 Tax=Bracon brevicornis TaxID=1563983 RepID=A0A6V7IKU3_9HYME
MRRSRKGTRLNDAQYFDRFQQVPTKKVPHLRVVPDSSLNSKNESKLPRSKNGVLRRNQPSLEITKVNFTESPRASILEENSDDQRHFSSQTPGENSNFEILKQNKLKSEVLKENTLKCDIFEKKDAECDVFVSPDLKIDNSIEMHEIFRKISETSQEIGKIDGPIEIGSHNEEADDIFKDAECLTSQNFMKNCGKLQENDENTRDNDGENWEKAVRSEEEQRKEVRTWWRVIIEFFGFFWGKKEEKSKRRHRTKRAEGRTVIGGGQEERNRQIYASSLNREKKMAAAATRADKMADKEGEEGERLRSRQMSSPLC